jgi:hypothetical protein
MKDTEVFILLRCDYLSLAGCLLFQDGKSGLVTLCTNHPVMWRHILEENDHKRTTAKA